LLADTAATSKIAIQQSSITASFVIQELDLTFHRLMVPPEKWGLFDFSDSTTMASEFGGRSAFFVKIKSIKTKKSINGVLLYRSTPTTRKTQTSQTT
jgi:hypothetical protein